MSEMKRTGDLEIHQDLKFQKKEWNFERIGWVGMLAIALAALLGVFGEGLLSNRSVKNGLLGASYGRFERILSVTEIKVLADAQLASDGELRLSVGRNLLSFYNVWNITPQPDQSELSPDHITYVFITGQDQGALEISFNLQGSRTGIARGEIAVEDGPAIYVTQLIYP
jgi:hypothetical protein